MSETDAKIMQALGDGARTHHIASKMGWDTPRANRALRRLEKDGIVTRDTARSAVNDIRWLRGHRSMTILSEIARRGETI